MKTPTAVIIGRSNVGKSSLFNKIIESKTALVFPKPGTTRDYLEAEVSWRGKKFNLIDTGGADPSKDDSYKTQIIKQAQEAQKKADIILFMADASVGPIPEDKKIFSQIRMSGKQAILVANKCDNKKRTDNVKKFSMFGLKIMPTSAISGSGVGDLLDETAKFFKNSKPDDQKPRATIALIGKPNVGKSSIFNALLGEERMIVSDKPHTTRDSQDAIVKEGKNIYKIIDTAGIRKKTKHGDEVEKISIEKSKQAISKSDVVALVIDASEEMTSQEARLANEIQSARKKFLIVINKWDLIEGKTTKSADKIRKYIKYNFPNLKKAPIVYAWKDSKKSVKKILSEAQKLVAKDANKKNNQ